MDKGKRQEALLTLVQAKPVGNQQQIVELMREAGFSATQASISRDIRELGLVKLSGRYMPAEGVVSPLGEHVTEEPVFGLITEFEPIGATLIVIHTAIGAASSVGVALDDKQLDEVAGTVAGDDTQFVAHRTIDARAELFDDFLRYLIFANALRGDVYPLCVSVERVVQAKRVALYGVEIGAAALVHGSTGAGNDQVRFDVAFGVFAPNIEILTPIRQQALSREAEVAYL